METLNSKTTAPEPKDLEELSNHLEIKRRDATITCEKHGEQIVSQFSVFGDYGQAKCPACTQEADEHEAKMDAERRARNAIVDRERRIADLMKSAHIPERFEKKGFEQFEESLFDKGGCKEICMSYAKNFAALRKRGTGMVMAGTTGTGKTHLACSIAKHVIATHAMSALYTTTVRAFRSVKATYSSSSQRSEQDALATLTKPDLLIMDEVGVSFGSDAEKMIFFDIINERYEHMRPTILLSNLALPVLTEAAGQRVIDRMKENGGVFLQFDWPSHRGNEK